jgi:cell wall-associated NlpC family hydrolase
MRNLSRPQRLLGVLAAVSAVLAMTLAPAPASGDSISEKKAEAQRIAAQLDDLGQQVSILDEQYNQANLRLAEVRAEVAAAKAKVAKTASDIQNRKAELARYAVDAYVHGGDTHTLSVLMNSDGSDYGQRRGYLTAAVGDRQDLIDQLQVAQQDLQDRTAALGDAEREAGAAAKSVASKRAATEKLVSSQEQVLNRVKGELATLVRQEQERKAAELARVANARAQRLAADQARRQSAAPVRTRTTPNSSSRSGPAPAPKDDYVPSGPAAGASAALDAARSRIGKPYRWGGSGPDSFDCSGLTMWSWAHAGVSLPHSAAAQYNGLRHVPLSQLQPGDLVFYGSPPHHVGIYEGGGVMINALKTGTNVRRDSIYIMTPSGAARP